MQIVYNLYLNHTGYSIAAQDYILSMLHVNPDVDIKTKFLNYLTNLGVSKNRQQLMKSMEKKEDRKPQTVVFHSIPHRYLRSKGPKGHIGICLFETISVPKKWVPLMNDMDRIITASTFNENVFKDNGVTAPIVKVPHAFDPSLFHKDIRSSGRYNLFTFLSIGTWKRRKNWELLIKSFYDAFEAKDKVCLLIKTEKPADLKQLVVNIKKNGDWRAKDTAPIYSEESSNCNFEDMPRIMSKGDVYICPSLGEGFGLPGLQAMALGIPLITTRFGGSLEYALPHLCTYLEPCSYKTYPTMDNIPQYKGCIWPVLRISEIRSRMRYAYENYEDVKRKAQAAYNYVHKTYTYDVIGKQMIKAIHL